MFGDPPSQRQAEDLAFSVARFFSKNGTLANYYMVCSLSQVLFLPSVLFVLFFFFSQKCIIILIYVSLISTMVEQISVEHLPRLLQLDTTMKLLLMNMVRLVKSLQEN